MADFPTFQDLFRVARDEVLTRNSALTREIVERPGADANALTAAGVAVGDEVVGQLIRVNTALFLDTAKKADLDRLVFDRYQILRKGASPARGTVQFSTSAAVLVGFSIPAGTQLRTTDNKTFVTTAQVTFPGGSSGPITVPVQSSLGGLNQQARANTITSIQGTIPSAPADLTVTNAAATAGADDAESDDSLRDRAKRFYTSSKRGTIKAIELGALSTPGVRTATAFESLESDGTPARIVEVVVSDAFTQQLVDSTTLPAAYQTQAATLAAAVQTQLYDVRAAGIYVSVTLAVVRLLGVTLALRFRAGADIDAATTQAKTVIVNYVNSLRPGQTFVHADAEDRLRTVPGLVVLGGEVASPSGDVLVLPLEVLRTDLGLVVVGACDCAVAA